MKNVILRNENARRANLMKERCDTLVLILNGNYSNVLGETKRHGLRHVNWLIEEANKLKSMVEALPDA
jgi:hypothetical protein